MKLIDTITNSDTWKSDLLCLSDAAISHALVACAELVFPVAECRQIRSLMPSIRRWTKFPDRDTSLLVESEVYRYIYNTGLFEAGGAQFLNLPTGRWPNVLEDTAVTFADDSVLYAANSIATIGQQSFFGSAGRCLDYAELSLQFCGFLADKPFEKLLGEKLRQTKANDG